MLRFLLHFFVLLCGYFLGSPSYCAAPIVQLRLQVTPRTHAFTCQYTFQLPAADTASVVQLLLNRQFPIQHLTSPHAS